MRKIFAVSSVLSLIILTGSMVSADAIRVLRLPQTVAATVDLTISDAEFAPASPQIGDKIDLAVRVQNRGTTAAAAFGVHAIDQTGWQSVGAGVYLPAGDTKVVHLTFLATEKNRQQILANNPHRFQINVDPRNLIRETNESNNVYYKDLTVRDNQVLEEIRPVNFKIADYVNSNNERAVVLEWSDATIGVNYDVRFHTNELVNNNPIDPSTTYGMGYYTQTTQRQLKYFLSDDNVSETYKQNVANWPKVALGHYTKEGSYNALTVYALDELVNEFAIIATKGNSVQTSRGARIYYQSPESLDVDNFYPTENSSFENGITLGWTNQQSLNDGIQYAVRYYSGSTENRFELAFYTADTDAGLHYYYADSNAAIKEASKDFIILEHRDHGNGVYSAEVGSRPGTYLVESYNPHNNQREVSNVIMIPALPQNVSGLVFTIQQVNNDNRIMYGADTDVFKFTVSAVNPDADRELRRITLNVNSSGLNTGNNGLGRINGWKLYNWNVDPQTPLAMATLTNNQVEFNFPSSVIVRGGSALFLVRATVLDDGMNNVNFLETAFKIDYNIDVDANIEGVQISGYYEEINDPEDGNGLIWRTTEYENNNWKNGYGLEMPSYYYVLS